MPIATELAVDNTASALTLAQTIFGSGVVVNSATLTGVNVQSGTYSGGDATLGDLAPSDTGIILSTGNVADFTNSSGTADTNTAAGTGTGHSGAGDADLDTVSGQTTNDAVVLEANFTPTGDYLTMQFTFSSEEYLEYVNGGVNDAFGVWVNGTYVPFTPAPNDLVSIDTINDSSASNLYIDNPQGSDTYNTEMDGATITLSIKAPVNTGVSNTIKIALADGGDDVYDSNVLIAANSVQTIALAFDDAVSMEPNTSTTIDVLANDTDQTGGGLTITEINGTTVAAGQSVILPTGENVTLNADGTLTIASDGDVGSEPFTYTVTDSAGNTDIGLVTINTVADIPLDYVVEGTGGADTIDAAYVGDPEGDQVDNADAADGSNDDSIEAYGGNDSINAGVGNDTIDGGTGADTIDGGTGNDSIIGGTGDDSILGNTGDDTVALENGFGNDRIFGGETGETTGDTLDLTGITEDITVDLSNANSETGTVSNGTDTASFQEIENIALGSGADTLILGDGGGNDTVDGFNITDSGDGTAIDQLDVSALTSDGGTTPVTTSDVVVTDTNGDGTGDAILTFPGGESITLAGVAPGAVDSPAELQAIGIPAAPVTIHDAIVLDAIPGGTDLLTSGSEMLSVSDNLVFNVETAGELNIGDSTDIGGTSYKISAIYDYEGDMTNTGGISSTETVGYSMIELDDGAGTTIPMMLLEDGFADKVDITEIQLAFVTPSATGISLTVYDNNDLVTLAAAPALDYIVEGTAGADLIDFTYIGDPEGDQVDAGDMPDGSDRDSIEAGAGDDTIFSGFGDDTIIAGAGHDSLVGQDGNDSLDGGSGNDTMQAGDGNDTLIGGDGDDSMSGDAGNDYIVGGDGDDWLRGSFGEDTIIGGTGDDTLWGGYNDDLLVVDANFGNYTVDAEEEAETLGDTMDVSAVTDDLTWDLSAVGPESGSFTNGTNTASFIDVENIILGSGTDTLVLDTFGGSERVIGFATPTDTGGGTYSGNDLLDVSGLTDFDGNPTHTGNVVVSDDGSGNAVLTFGNGETLTLVGVPVADVSTPAQLVAMGIPQGPDGYVDGTAGNDVIDAAYTGDPTFDLIDAGDAQLPGAAPNDDYVRAGAGDDSVLSDAGDDTVELGSGNDTADGGVGDDTLSGEAGNDSLIGGLGDDSLVGGDGDDTLNGQIGADVLQGGSGSDVFALEDDFGNDTIVGGEVNDATGGDTLDMSGLGGSLSYDLTGVDAESGTVGDGTSTLTFSEIENIELSSGTDTIVLDNGSGDDTVSGFTAPFDDGFGTWVGIDQVDVSSMVDGNGALVNTGDVTVTDDGSGNAVLNFPGGESLTLVGVAPTAFPVPEALAAIGIPLADYIVEGTAAGELIDSSYLGDPEGDLVDAGDGDPALANADSDSIEAGAGDDTIFAGVGDDTVFGDTGNDLMNGQAGDDSLVGGLGSDSIAAGSGNDTVLGGDDNDTINAGSGDDSVEGGAGDDLMSGAAGADTLLGGDGNDTFAVFDGFGDDTVVGSEVAETTGDTLDLSGVSAEGVSIGFNGSESGLVTGGTSGDTVDFSEIENITATDNADTIDAGLDANGVNIDAGGGDDIVTGGTGSDTISGGSGDDTLNGGLGGDSISGGLGNDTINVAQGDTVTGGDGDDFFNITDLGEIDTGTITITGGEGDETDGDTLALNGLHDSSTLVITDPDDVNGGLSGTVTLLNGTVVNFTNIENIICFVPGTLIATPSGLQKIEDLKVGDPVVTQDNGVQSIGWIGKSTVPACDKFAPVCFKQTMWPGSLGDLIVSPQHRMLIKGYRAELLFGQSEVLVPAVHLVDGGDVRRLEQQDVTYVHIMFDQHEIIFANGVPAESFHPGAFGVDALAPQARDELFALFPSLRSDLANYGTSARMALKSSEARLLADMT